MAKVHIGAGPTNLSDGLLQLQNGDAMDATLRIVTDQNNTTSPLKLSTGLVSVSSTLQIATSDTQYLDAEDLGGNNRFTISRNAGSQVVNVDFASNPTLGTDQVGAIRTYQNGVSLSDAIGFQKNGQVTFTERVKIEADSTSTTQSAAVIQSTTTNAGLVLQPNGTGAIMASVPDGTATGGNARGQNAVDLQTIRNANSQVAGSDYSTIGGGRNNTASGSNSTVSGGSTNSAASTSSTVIGGSSCTASAANSIAGSDQTTASGLQSIGIGSESQATGGRAIVFGRQGQAVGGNSAILGGQGNRVEGSFSLAHGGGALVKTAYQRVYAASFEQSGNAQIQNYSGRAQEGCVILGYNSRLTGSGNPPQLQASASTFTLKPGNGTSASNIAWIPATANQQFTFQIKLMATVTAISGTATGVNVGDVKQWTFEGSGKIVSSTVTILNSGTTPVVLYEDSGLSSMSAQFIVGSSNSVGVEITNAIFVGGGDLELMVNGYLYFQESALN